MTSEFERIQQARLGGTRRGRPSTLTPEEKAERKKTQNAKNRLRNEARRRAYLVMQYRYEEEFQKIFSNELENLRTKDSRYSDAV